MSREQSALLLQSRIQGLLQQGCWIEATEESAKLTAFAPHESIGWSFLGFAELQRGRFIEAETALRKAVGLQPNDALTLTNLSVAVDGLGRPAEAEQFARRALSIDPSNSAIWTSLGAFLCNQQKWPEAAEAAHQAVKLDPQNAKAWSNLGGVLQELGRLDSAQVALERSLSLAPGRMITIVNYASLLVERGQPQQALDLMRSLLSQEPVPAAALVVQGNALRKLDSFGQAVASYESALRSEPQNRNARLALALLHSHLWHLPESERQLREFLTENPRSAKAWSELGVVVARQGRTEEAVTALRHSLELDSNAKLHNTLLLHLQYEHDIDSAALLTEHRQWNAVHGSVPAANAPLPAAKRIGPLRVGFVSADFIAHPTSFFVLPTLECLDQNEISITCYSDRVTEDAFTHRFRAVASNWRTTAGQTTEELVQQIRSDNIDILVDLMGHTGDRLPVFLRRPAPMQVTWFGYVGTTGLATMDFLVADRFHVRPGEDANFVERIIRMPNGYAAYGPLADAPDVNLLPALATAKVTFGCFNNPSKFTPRIFDAWSEVMQRVPASQLLLKYKGLEQPQVHKWLRGQFANCGVEPNRVSLEGGSPFRQMLESYNRVDLALDTQPYSGGLTTCESLWMGVPVITFPGKTFAGRHSVSHLTNAGFPQFIASDLPGYIELAVEWANRLDELAVVRSTMRERMRQSPLCDAPTFARDFTSVLREAWESLVNR